MKRILPILLFVLSAKLSWACLEDTDANIRLTVQTFSLPLESVTEVMVKSDGKNPEIHQLVMALTGKDKAKLVDTIMVTSRWGELGEAGSYREFIYPTEFDPPDLNGSGIQEHPPVFNGGVGMAPEGNSIPSTLGPTAFETRYLGTTLGSSSVFDSKTCTTSQVDVSIDELVELKSHFKHHDNWGKVDMKMPVFDSWRPSSHWRSSGNVFLNLKPGTFTLFTTHRPSAAKATVFENARVLIFVRADIIEPKP